MAGVVLGLGLGLTVVKEARALAQWWKDTWAPLTYASVANLSPQDVYATCAEDLGLSREDPDLTTFAYESEVRQTSRGWLWQDVIKKEHGKGINLPFACEISGDSVDFMTVKTIVLTPQ